VVAMSLDNNTANVGCYLKATKTKGVENMEQNSVVSQDNVINRVYHGDSAAKSLALTVRSILR